MPISASSRAPTEQDYRNLIRAMYTVHNPAKLDTIDALFIKYAGKEAKLYQALCVKYVLPMFGLHDNITQPIGGRICW